MIVYDNLRIPDPDVDPVEPGENEPRRPNEVGNDLEEILEDQSVTQNDEQNDLYV